MNQVERISSIDEQMNTKEGHCINPSDYLKKIGDLRVMEEEIVNKEELKKVKKLIVNVKYE